MKPATTNAITTTLKDIRAASPCTDGWEKLLKHLGKSPADARSDDTPLEVLTVLKSNGMDDALWVLDNAVGNKYICRLFAADCSEMVLPLFERERPDDMRPREAIALARDPAAGDAAGDDAWDAAWAAARAAAGVAAWDAAGDAARDAAWAAVGDAAWAAARAAAGDAAGDAARVAAWDAAWAAVWARLKQYLTHGEAAKDMDWPEKLTFDVLGKSRQV